MNPENATIFVVVATQKTLKILLTPPHPSWLNMASRMLVNCSNCCFVELAGGPCWPPAAWVFPEEVAMDVGAPDCCLLTGCPQPAPVWLAGGCCPAAGTFELGLLAEEKDYFNVSWKSNTVFQLTILCGWALTGIWLTIGVIIPLLCACIILVCGICCTPATTVTCCKKKN